MQGHPCAAEVHVRVWVCEPHLPQFFVQTPWSGPQALQVPPIGHGAFVVVGVVGETVDEEVEVDVDVDVDDGEVDVDVDEDDEEDDVDGSVA